MRDAKQNFGLVELLKDVLDFNFLVLLTDVQRLQLFYIYFKQSYHQFITFKSIKTVLIISCKITQHDM